MLKINLKPSNGQIWRFLICKLVTEALLEVEDLAQSVSRLSLRIFY